MSKAQKVRPPKYVWLQYATEAAVAADIHPERVLTHFRDKASTRARLAAWAAILATGRYTVAGLAKVCGWHHTSILYGLKMIRRSENISAQAKTVADIELPKPLRQLEKPPTAPNLTEWNWQKSDRVGREHDAFRNFRTSSRSDELSAWWPEFSAAKKKIIYLTPQFVCCGM
ncbi:hypothetical protein KGQ27_04010 [Patescibacteria group bacterium]|nr:hypothetical protein [Patescibacteria group bacterium]